MMKDTCSLFSPLHQGLIENRDEWVRRAGKNSELLKAINLIKFSSKLINLGSFI